jgi:hypothetical protein
VTELDELRAECSADDAGSEDGDAHRALSLVLHERAEREIGGANKLGAGDPLGDEPDRESP